MRTDCCAVTWGKTGIVRVLLWTVFALVPLQVSVACSSEEADAADTTIGEAAKSWAALFKHYNLYRSCDDGAIAEGYSDAAVRLFANRWDGLAQFAKLARKDDGFRIFVLKHVDATADFRDLRRVRKNAKNACPAGSQKLCRQIDLAARRALSEGLAPSEH